MDDKKFPYSSIHISTIDIMPDIFDFVFIYQSKCSLSPFFPTIIPMHLSSGFSSDLGSPSMEITEP